MDFEVDLLIGLDAVAVLAVDAALATVGDDMGFDVRG